MTQELPEPEETTDSDDYMQVDPAELENGDDLDSTSFPPTEG